MPERGGSPNFLHGALSKAFKTVNFSSSQTNHDLGNIERGILLHDYDSSEEGPFRELASIMTGLPEDDLQLVKNSCIQWYRTWLQCEIRDMQADFYLQVRYDSSISSNGSQEQSFPLVCAELAFVAKLLRDQEFMTLEHPLEQLQRSSHWVASQSQHLNNRLRSLQQQVVFAYIGFLTMLYQPVMCPAKDQLQIVERKIGHNHSRNTVKQRSFQLHEYDGIPLSDLLWHFGGRHGLIPRGRSWLSMEGDSRRPGTLTAANVSYYTLTKLTGVEIMWVGCICEHLEFDPRSKVLKLFQFPSFCAMLCLNLDDSIYMERLLEDYFANDEQNEPSRQHTLPVPTADLLREVIYSYRLLFGQDRSSYRAFRKDRSKYAAQYDFENGSDPLLPRLCGSDWSKEIIYAELEAPNVKTVYPVYVDFAFFGDRLLDFQDFVSIQCPNSWMTLYRDRRDINRFWTLWVVVFLGIATTFLAIVQIALQVIQISQSAG